MESGASPSDEALVRRAKDGDEEAFRTLFQRHAAALAARIRRRLPSHLRRKISVADLLQETRIVAFRRRPDFDPDRGSFRNWLLGIAVNKVREAVREQAGPVRRAGRREVSRGDRADTGDFPGPHPSPSQAAVSSELRDRVQEALRALPEDYREIILLAREQGLSLREAADRMGRSREAAKKLYGRAICRLRTILKDLQEDPDA